MYRVDWLEVALNELAQFWMASNSTMRERITQATNEIDTLLADDPLVTANPVLDVSGSCSAPHSPFSSRSISPKISS